MTSEDAPPTGRDWALRAEVYRSFVEDARAPTYAELGAALDLGEDEVRSSVERLYAAHQIAPLSDRSGIWMANPFSAVETAFPVETPAGRVYAACAWDAFGVPALLGCDARISTRCAESRTPLEVRVGDGRLEGDEGVLHLVVPPRDAWLDVGFT